MWLAWLAAGAVAQAPGCDKIGWLDVVEVSAPAVLVLGERKGTWPDLIRAERLVSRLARTGPLTLALESVSVDKQPVLDRYEAGEAQLGDLPELLAWSQHWGFGWESYQGLLSVGAYGAQFVAVGHPVELRPQDTSVPLPPGYIHVLLDAMGDAPPPVPTESTLVQTAAWKDFRIARDALAGWDGEGYLVILADRLHVEGGLGISWQAQRLTDVPVHAFLLANGGAACYAGDQVWRDHPLDR